VQTRALACRDGIGFVEEQHRVLLPRQAEDGGDVLGRLSRPHRLHFSVANDQQLLAEGMGDGLGADRFSRPGGSGEVERDAEPGRVPLTQAPAFEDQPVTPHLRQRLIQGAASRRWKDHVGQRPPRRDRFDRMPPAEAGSEKIEQ